MKTLEEIMEIIDLPGEVGTELISLEPELNRAEIEELLVLLTEEARWEDARISLKELLEPDEKGLKMLLCMLKAAAYSYEKYKIHGISDRIFADTMKCFTRFVKEHKVSYGYYGFDRDFWTGRQLSLLIFRLGELEFEKCVKDEEYLIGVHIPSDGSLSGENCEESVRQSRSFFERYDKRFAGVPYTCYSWLLSPALKELLPADSRILRFQEMFRIEHIYQEETAYKEWVFKRRDISPEEMPEDTSLQRKMKEHLLNGGWIGEAEGVLIEK